MNEKIDKLMDTNGKLCAEVNRQERVIEEQRAQIARLVGSNEANRARIRALEKLACNARWLIARTSFENASQEKLASEWCKRAGELGLEAKR